MAALNAHKLVFIDESFCKTSMRREHGWALRGQRLRASRPGRSWRTLSIAGAIRLGDRPRVMTHRGSINGRIFLKFVRQRLVPWLRRDDVVVMDNLNTHKMKSVREAIEAVGARVVFLPTYSPELNPIEMWWADMKRQLRKLGIDDEVLLAKAVRRLRTALPLAKIRSWFRLSAKHRQLN